MQIRTKSGVESIGRFIRKENSRIGDQRPRNRSALFLTA